MVNDFSQKFVDDDGVYVCQRIPRGPASPSVLLWRQTPLDRKQLLILSHADGSRRQLRVCSNYKRQSPSFCDKQACQTFRPLAAVTAVTAPVRLPPITPIDRPLMQTSRITVIMKDQEG